MSNSVNSAGGTGLRSYEEYMASQRNLGKELGQDEFLALLAAQLKYQDPMEPTKDTDFIAQLAQFNSLEAMSSMSNMMEQTYYYNMVGKYVYAEINIDGVESSISGQVDRVISKDGKMYAQVGDYLVEATKISQVYSSDLFSASNPLLDTAHLIGREVTSTTLNDAGEQVQTKGIVNKVTYDSGILTAHLDTGETVPVNTITEIKDAGASTGTDSGDETV